MNSKSKRFNHTVNLFNSHTTKIKYIATITFNYFQLLESIGHVHFVHPSTDISTNTQPMYWSAYWSTPDRYLSQHIGRHSANTTTKICRLTYQPIYHPRYRLSYGRHVGWLLADISVDREADTQPISWPLIVDRILADCQWYIGPLSHNYVRQKLRLKASCSELVPQIQSLSSKTLKKKLLN